MENGKKHCSMFIGTRRQFHFKRDIKIPIDTLTNYKFHVKPYAHIGILFKSFSS